MLFFERMNTSVSYVDEERGGQDCFLVSGKFGICLGVSKGDRQFSVKTVQLSLEKIL